jgi:lysophospholipase L1-like esterase
MSKWLLKVWEGDTVFEEPVCFSNKEDYSVGECLLYAPSQIIKVTSSDGSCLYEKGKDFTVCGNKIYLTADSRIPVLNKNIYCAPFRGESDKEWLRMVGGEYYVKIFPELYKYQVLVTYRHEEGWNGFIPENKSAALPCTMQRLVNKKHLNLVFYGDSITAGWEASGCDENVIDMYTLKEFHNYIHRSPYMPAWATLVTNEIMERYGHNDIIKVNRGAGGSTSAWGDTNAAALINEHNPDTVILAFGMNNFWIEPEKYKQEITGIISTIRSKSPDCEFLLVSPMVPNSEIQCYINNKIELHQKVLFDIQNTMPGVAAVPVNTMFHELIRCGKKYMDISGNCVNHPNDFSVRIYAQVILSVLGL